MTKKIWYLFLSLLVGASVFMYDAFNVSRAEYALEIAKHRNNSQDSFVGKKAGELPPNLYFKRQYLLEMNPRTGKTSPENIEALKQTQQSQVEIFKVPGESNQMAWVERGPDNIGGRTRMLFYDPNDITGKRVFAGGVSGGLWVNNNITDENSLWIQVGIDENLSVSCYAIDPNDSNIWYVGTGESYTHNDGTGNGLWKTTNGGATWSQVKSVNFNDHETNRLYFINEIIAWDNQGTTELFMAVDGTLDYDFVGYQLSGWWKLSDGDFNRITFQTANNTPYVFSDVEIALDNSMWFATKNNAFGHGGGKIFRSTDGNNFVEKYSFTDGDRVAISVSKQNNNTVYAVAEIIDNGVQFVKTTNGTDFSELSKPSDADNDIEADDFTRGQAFYDLMLEVDPSDDDVLYTGGIDLFRSSNGGSNWAQISKWSNNNNLKNLNVSLVHADQHALAFHPTNSNQGVFGNDGGVFYSNSLSLSATSNTAILSRNKNYNVTQLYSAAIGQDINNIMFLGGAQDNGSLFVAEANAGINSFGDLYGGDGAQVFIDKDGDYAIVSYVFNTYSLQPLPFESFNDQIEIVDDQNSGDFINIADLDDNLDILYTNGSTGNGNNIAEKISRFTNITSIPVRENFTDDLLDGAPTAIKVSPFTSTSSTVFVGTETGLMLKVTNFNTTPVWSAIDVSETINAGAISDIAFGKNENEIIVTLHNYGVDNIYYTMDGGAHWEVKDGDLPDIPTKAVLMNSLDENEVIVGTNFGVWKTNNFTDDVPNWTQSQSGMSSVKVTQLEMREADNTVLASTYGRGFFTGQFTGNDLSVVEVSSEDKNQLELTTVVINKSLEITSKEIIQSPVHLNVYSTIGALVLSKELDFKGVNKQLVAVPFQSGIYIVNLFYDNHRISKKIMVMD